MNNSHDLTQYLKISAGGKNVVYGSSVSPKPQPCTHWTHEEVDTKCRVKDVTVGNAPPPIGGRFGLSAPLSILGTWYKKRSGRRAVRIKSGGDGEKRMPAGDALLSSGPVTLRYFLPPHPHSICQTPLDVSKTFWIIDKPKRDASEKNKYKNRPGWLEQTLGHWQFPF